MNDETVVSNLTNPTLLFLLPGEAFQEIRNYALVGTFYAIVVNTFNGSLLKH